MDEPVLGEPSDDDVRFLEDRLYEFNVEATGQRDGRVSVPLGEGRGSVRFSLKPGQTIDRGTGEVRDVLGPNGELRVSPAK